jgi:hypothetical protein
MVSRRTFLAAAGAAPILAQGVVNPPKAAAAATVPVKRSGYWWSDFQSPTALTPASGPPAAGAEWSGWGQGDQATYGIPALVSAAAGNLPAPPSGDRILRLRHTGPQSKWGSDYSGTGPHNMHKLYKQFTTKTWPTGAEPTDRNDGAPADVSARYISYLYISSLQLQLVTGYWVNMFQFKEDYANTNNQFVSNPSWWLGWNAFNTSKPIVNLSCWGGRHTGPTKPLSDILDHWVKFEYRLYQGNKLEVYIDDVLFDVGLNSEYAVGRMDFPGQRGSSGDTVKASLGWTFGVGNYTNGNDYPAAASGMYVDLSCLQPIAG